MATVEHFLDRYLDPLTDALSPEAAQKVLELQPASEDIARVEELGEKANAGTITETELNEYRLLADVGSLMALFKAKARRSLARHAR